MNLLSLFAESIRVANSLEKSTARDGLDRADRFAADFCRAAPKEAADSGEFKLLGEAFMKPF